SPPLLLSSLSSHRLHRDLHSFPTRRSSDLLCNRCSRARSPASAPCGSSKRSAPMRPTHGCIRPHPARCLGRSTESRKTRARHFRSEEHTSELQSRGHLVCRLLLEKKKNERL